MPSGLMQLEAANRQLKEIVANQARNIKALGNVNSKNWQAIGSRSTVGVFYPHAPNAAKTTAQMGALPPGLFALWHGVGICHKGGGEHVTLRPPNMHCRRRSGCIPAESDPPRQLANHRHCPPLTQLNPIAQLGRTNFHTAAGTGVMPPLQFVSRLPEQHSLREYTTISTEKSSRKISCRNSYKRY
jgi:hypothetical protein